VCRHFNVREEKRIKGEDKVCLSPLYRGLAGLLAGKKGRAARAWRVFGKKPNSQREEKRKLLTYQRTPATRAPQYPPPISYRWGREKKREPRVSPVGRAGGPGRNEYSGRSRKRRKRRGRHQREPGALSLYRGKGKEKNGCGVIYRREKVCIFTWRHRKKKKKRRPRKCYFLQGLSQPRSFHSEGSGEGEKEKKNTLAAPLLLAEHCAPPAVAGKESTRGRWGPANTLVVFRGEKEGVNSELCRSSPTEREEGKEFRSVKSSVFTVNFAIWEKRVIWPPRCYLKAHFPPQRRGEKGRTGVGVRPATNFFVFAGREKERKRADLLAPAIVLKWRPGSTQSLLFC